MLKQLFSLEGKNAVITGGCRGIGYMMAKGLLSAGAEVYITGRDADFTKTSAHTLSEFGKCHAITAELSSEAGVTALIDTLNDKLDHLDILINNAAVHKVAPINESSYSDWQEILSVNLVGAFELSRGLLPLLRKRASLDDPSRIINIGSDITLLNSDWDRYQYSASKAALQHTAVKLANELTVQGINVNAIVPGTFDTRMIDDREKADVFAHLPLQRAGNELDIAGVAILLCARAGNFISGAVIPVDAANYCITG